uniref:Uncharacterized protein n=1 Tax=Fagus sylvatica TaxID=28930 RepID=A0A2N9F0U6_FAGSY
MQNTVGKLGKSTFQRYKVRANRSLDERVMAPGSRGVWAVFSHFSGKDSDQMGDATGELRVASRSWSCNLSNAPRLVDQLAAIRKDSAREGDSPGGKNVPDFPPEIELGLERYGPANGGHRSVFGLPEGNFPIKIPARPEKILTIRELHVVHGYVLFLKFLDLRINSLRVGKTLRKASATYFLKVRALHGGEFGFVRCGPANRGCWNVSHVGRSFFDRDSGLTGGAFDNPRVAHCR